MIRLKQILESKITETPLADILSGSDKEQKYRVLFIGDNETADNNSYANNLLEEKIVTGDVVSKLNLDVIKLAKIINQYGKTSEYDIISIMVPNSIVKTVSKTTRILEEVFKFAKRNTSKLIVITNPINFNLKSGDDLEIKNLQELAEWITTQNITDDVIDTTKFGSSYFERDGYKLNLDGQREVSDLWKNIVEEYDIAPMISTNDKQIKSKKSVKRDSGIVYVDNSDIVTGANFLDSLENQATRLLARFEGFSAEPGWDVNAWRIGHGSSTITTESGEVIRLGSNRSVQPNIVITREDAARDLKRRLENEFIPDTKRAIGSVDLPNGVIAALVSVAYNYGSLPNSVRNAARSEDIQAIADAIRSREGDNGGINAKRRNKEANYVLAAGGIE
jgi:GH24 family phage-related lysozyme (muramidase)